MRPPIDDRAILILRAHLPELESHYIELLDIYEEDLTPQVVFNELAEVVSGLLRQAESEELLEACVAALELVAAEPDAEGTELVAFCFLDQLPAFALEALRSYLGPVTGTILELLEQDLVYEADEQTPPFTSGRL